MFGKCLHGFSNVRKNIRAAVLWRSNPWNSKTPLLSGSTAPARNAGLTLVEVMLAIVILGIGAGTLMTATARCMAVATKSKHYSRAHRLIMQVGAENPLTRGDIDDGTESGSFDDGYSWEREIIESEEEDREGLYTVRTRVSWSARGRESFEEVTSYLYIPPEDKNKPVPDRKTRKASSSSKSSGSTSDSGGSTP
jgi:prepilin-type N-terminal cleavage/methylation domain-containing protein